jgi:hypothetical protein
MRQPRTERFIEGLQDIKERERERERENLARNQNGKTAVRKKRLEKFCSLTSIKLR